MLEKRLIIAKKLLNPKESVLIVTIDELEYNHLGCLLEQLFPEARIQMISSVINPSGVSRGGEFYRTDEYIFIVKLGTCSPCRLRLTKEWLTSKNTGKDSVRWRPVRRQGSHDLREDAQNQFYPIYIAKDGSHFIEAGETLNASLHPQDIKEPDEYITLWPIKPDGTEGCWQISQESLRSLNKEGFVKVTYTKKWGYTIKYLAEGERKKVLDGTFEIIGRDEYGVLQLASAKDEVPFIPGTQWRIQSHSAREQGSTLLNSIIGNRFSFPKSIYAEHDAIRFFVANKPNALILDFFAGSGTTLHAVNLLNAEDGGNRRCIMVTNNEIGEAKEKELIPQGIRPGDEEWEKWGIARYVNWPRTKCSIKGVDVNGKPIDADYITSIMETKVSDRRFNQINFFTETPSLKQKKALVSFINKQKDVKLPSISEDANFLLAEDDDSCNASILFDVTAIDDWKDALEGHDEITDFYVVTQKNSLFRQIKAEISELMGPIEESVPVTIPMKDGFKANAIYFKLGFLDKTSVALGRQFKELLPILWMKAGARGECPTIEGEELPKMLVCEKNHFAVLIDENVYPQFEKKINEANGIDVVYIITDSDSGYKEMAQGLHVETTYQLYRDYLDNFRINNVR